MKRFGFTHGTAPDTTVPGSSPIDYVVVDDVGDFSYYPSEAAMLDNLEYVDEAACILDRAGNDYRLTMDKDRHLRLGPSLGTVEFNWLRQAWTTNQRRNMQTHPLQRFSPETLEALLAGLFEMLYLEQSGRTTDTPWVLEVDGEVTHPATLQEVNGLLTREDHLERVTVHDPFGHDYQPIRHAGHRFSFPTGRSIYYVEVPGRFKRDGVHH
ncbi:hypothetical protein [Arthrobacter bambusae]|uniref:Uncharacterized protein n=1 Tax=Arthrobacter bambusae TaxID=1338426 RepID=A0AAW8DN29_9MICC|nr:hypothetical protein [Arthrobacter bambusae]MDP9907742.1 hypothetical protein [Arthrobacter bambusae]MDQ0131541.1 hypothetical protein [Arthrobacter bambusae]MDQ0182953.1 hypothetical protein [Arthrobacter bambusae]